MADKYCKDCRHEQHWDCWRGVYQQTSKVSLVTGNPINGSLSKFPPTCHSQRTGLFHWLPWNCGKRGKFFESK